MQIKKKLATNCVCFCNKLIFIIIVIFGSSHFYGGVWDFESKNIVLG